ncbi:phage tail length tape measure family protein [Sinorhizobium fredii]|uniref:phage tail length tape measure family protein n=1 Tax=Rhizobium fredii TaxID=380 RepID=UPI0004BC70BE|nr:phage tail length tape measure family protein [Sinorhizobium fredii]
MQKGVSIWIDPSGAQTGGRVVKRELKEIGDAAINAQKMTDQLTRAHEQMAKSAQGSALAIGQQQDMLRAKFNPTFAVLQRYKQTQEEIRQAHRLGAISVNEMTAALSRERQASLAAVAAIKGHSAAFAANTVAVNATNAAMRNAVLYRTQLLYQLNDIGVSLVSGMNSGMVLAQQGAQIAQMQGGIKAALRETIVMAGSAGAALGALGPIAIAAGAAGAAALSHIRSEASKALGETVTWGETLTAVFQVAWEGLKSTFGPAFSAVLDPVFYAFSQLGSAAVDIAEIIINAFRAVGSDIKFMWDQLPNIVGAAFVGAVNIAIDHLNKLANASKQAVNEIIKAFNTIPGVDLPNVDASGQLIALRENPYAAALARENEAQKAKSLAINNSHPIREFFQDSIDRIGTNRAQSRLADFADMDFSKSIQGANGLSQAVGGVGAAWQQAKSAVIDVNQQMADTRRNTLAGFEQSSKQLRTMKTELKEIQATLAAAAQTPVADVFGAGMSGQAAGAIDAAASSIQKIFAALNDGRMTAQSAHESLELIRASLHQLGGDRAKVDAWVDSLINANLHVGNLESGVKSLSASIMGIPNRVVQIGIQQYTVGTTGGGTKGVNVYGGNADFSYQQYDVGGKTIGVSAGNGSYGGKTASYYDSPYDLGILQDMGYQISGARASGGPVSAGGTYLVGENGPELLNMSGAGSVTNANSTASILSGGRDALSLIEDHLYNVVQELRIHTNYWETAESNDQEMIACLKALKSASGSVSYSGGSSASSSSRGSYGSGSSGSSGSSHLDPYSPYYFNAARNFAGTGGGRYDPVADAMLNGNTAALNGVSGGPTQGIARLLSGHNMPSLLDRLKRQVGFANNGQIMAGEDQKVEFFKRNKERVIIVDDNRVSDQRGKEPAKSERPIQIINNFNGGNIGDARSRQAMEDQFRRAVQSVK